MRYRMKDLLPQERPYEKCLQHGCQALSDVELLAVILRTGANGLSALELAAEVMKLLEERGEGLLGLHHCSLVELQRLKGIGKVKAIQIKCMAELSVRMAKARAREQISYDHPETLAAYYMEQLRHEEQEILLCVMLDTKNHLLGEQVISKGTVNSSLISPRELFLCALRYQAVHLILVHNHPSGDPTPSGEDVAVTRRIAEVGELLNIHLLDHIVIGDRQYVSMREESLI